MGLETDAFLFPKTLAAGELSLDIRLSKNEKIRCFGWLHLRFSHFLPVQLVHILRIFERPF